jgi:uncharacterized membrane protein
MLYELFLGTGTMLCGIFVLLMINKKIPNVKYRENTKAFTKFKPIWVIVGTLFVVVGIVYNVISLAFYLG